MERKLSHLVPVIAIVASALSIGCSRGSEGAPSAAHLTTSSGEKVTTSAPKESQPVAPVSTNRVTDRPANTEGKVVIVEYHHIAEGKGTMFRTPEQFKRDLERFYELGFRPVTVSEYLEDRMNLPPGASPMVFTFDDANPSQFQMNEDGSVKPDCGIGIWQQFAKEHPDFPIKATFYVLPDTMWGQRNLVDKKVAMLRDLGCELGNHTVTHPILKRLSDEKVKAELGDAALALESLGEKMPASLALPFGVSPKNKDLLKRFEWKGKRVEQKAVMLVGAEPARAPKDPKLNLMAIPRVQACEGPGGIEYWLEQIENERVKLYVQP